MAATLHWISTRADARQGLLGRLLGRQAAALCSSKLCHRASLTASGGVMDFADRCPAHFDGTANGRGH